MPTGSADKRLPEYFLIKLTRQDDAGKDEVHYIFAEIAASFNAQASGVGKTLETLWSERKGVDDRASLLLQATSLPAPGEYTQEWSYFSTKRQSGKRIETTWEWE